MMKRKNKDYVGKMTYYNSDREFVLTRKTGETVAQITIESSSNVSVRLMGSVVNKQEAEKGEGGRVIKGSVRARNTPLMTMKVAETKRTVLELHKPSEYLDDEKQDAPVQRSSVKYYMEMDYPLTIFISFAISVALESYRM